MNRAPRTAALKREPTSPRGPWPRWVREKQRGLALRRSARNLLNSSRASEREPEPLSSMRCLRLRICGILRLCGQKGFPLIRYRAPWHLGLLACPVCLHLAHHNLHHRKDQLTPVCIVPRPHPRIYRTSKRGLLSQASHKVGAHSVRGCSVPLRKIPTFSSEVQS